MNTVPSLPLPFLPPSPYSLPPFTPCTARRFVAVSLPEEIHGFMCNHRSGPIPASFMNTVPSLSFPPSLPPSLPSSSPSEGQSPSEGRVGDWLLSFPHSLWPLCVAADTRHDDGGQTNWQTFLCCLHALCYQVQCTCECVHVCTYTHSAAAVHVCM